MCRPAAPVAVVGQRSVEDGGAFDDRCCRVVLELTPGHDDDGEAGAGRVLLSLLESTDARGAVAVTRWYGGTPLGPARFRHIGSAGREALLNAGVIKK